MAVKLLGLPKEQDSNAIYEQCRIEGIKASEYFRIHGVEIKTIQGLRDNSLLFIVPSGNSFIYHMLSWITRTPITDEDEFVPESQRCKKTYEGHRCFKKEGHKKRCKALVFAEF